MIYIGFSRPRKFKIFSWLIMAFLGTNYSHVYLKFYDEYTHRWIIAEANHGEVHFIEQENWFNKNTRVREQFFEMDDRHRVEVIRFVIDHLQKPYSFTNILGIVLNQTLGVKWLLDGSKAFICSELIALALDNKIHFNKPLDLVTPKDIWKAI